MTDQMPPTNALIDQLTWRLSPEGRKILERVEALVPTGETDPADLEPAIALIESLLDEGDRRTIYRIMGLKARAYRLRGKEYLDEARLASQAVILIDHALDLERAAGREPGRRVRLPLRQPQRRPTPPRPPDHRNSITR